MTAYRPIPIGQAIRQSIVSIFKKHNSQNNIRPNEKILFNSEMLPQLVTDIPGPRSRILSNQLARYESRNITFHSSDFPIFWEKTEGTNVWDVDGNRFLDWTSGFGVSSLGFSTPSLHQAIQKQSQKLWHAMGDVHPTEVKVQLCQKLVEMTFERWGYQGKVILGNSGFEAIEVALKTAHLATGKRGVIVFEGSYHGLGYGALETTGLSYFRQPFLRQLPQFAFFVPYPYCYRCPFGCNAPERLLSDASPQCSASCLREIETQIRQLIQQQEIGAILVEPIQGRGGEIVPPNSFLPLLRQIANETNVLFILDEIYTGFWRTGSLFACDSTKIVPDLICLGKALTGGFPLSACVGKTEIMDQWPPSDGEALHTSTYLGNPLGCAMALASLTEWGSDRWTDHLKRLELELKTALVQLQKQHDIIGHVRGCGALWGLELIQSNGMPNSQACIHLIVQGLKQGLILLGGGIHRNILSLTPSFSITETEIAHTLQVLTSLLNEIQIDGKRFI